MWINQMAIKINPESSKEEHEKEMFRYKKDNSNKKYKISKQLKKIVEKEHMYIETN